MNVSSCESQENGKPMGAKGVSGWYGDCHSVLGDRWSLLILHNMVLRRINSFTELLESGAGIATNVLSDRLKKFLAKGIITVRPHDSDRRKLNYALTAKGKALEPVLAEMVRWNAKYLPRRTREKGRRDRT